MVQTQDEELLSLILLDLARKKKKSLWTWQINRGLIGPDGPVAHTRAADLALDYLLATQDRPLVWMKDFHHLFSPQVQRRLRDLGQAWKHSGGAVILSSCQRRVPDDLERDMVVIPLRMASQEEMRLEVRHWLTDSGARFQDAFSLESISALLKGLTLTEARHALARVASRCETSEEALPLLKSEKRRMIERAGTLEYVSDVPPLHHLGGLESLKEWLLSRKSLLVSDDAALQEIAPKGILLMGVSGCGKSLCIKAISSAWNLPLFRLEMVRIFSGEHGSPEEAFAKACRVMEEMVPAVLWIDEIEMGLAASGSEASNPVLARIFAFFLTWMQEKPAGLFVAATANRIDLLPAEMIRKGRFDQVFFVDLPTLEERREIFRIHITRRGYDPQSFDLDLFADSTQGWNGAEIEQCVVAAITEARMQDRDLEVKDLYRARKEIVPISTTMEEQVRHIRNWAYERAVRASKAIEHEI